MKTKGYEKILVAVDGSDNCKRAVNSAVNIAKLSGAELYGIHVIPPIPSFFGSRVYNVGAESTEDDAEAVKAA